MLHMSTKSDTSNRIYVSFDKEVLKLIRGLNELGDSDSSKVSNICVSWLNEKEILPGMIKKRLGLR